MVCRAAEVGGALESGRCVVILGALLNLEGHRVAAQCAQTSIGVRLNSLSMSHRWANVGIKSGH